MIAGREVFQRSSRGNVRRERVISGEYCVFLADVDRVWLELYTYSVSETRELICGLSSVFMFVSGESEVKSFGMWRKLLFLRFYIIIKH